MRGHPLTPLDPTQHISPIGPISPIRATSINHSSTRTSTMSNETLENITACRYVQGQPIPQRSVESCMGRPYVLGNGSI